MSTLRNLLTFAYGDLPQRGNIDNYVILPTGDGAAVIVIRPPTKRVIRRCSSSSSTDGEEEQEEDEENSPIDYSKVGSSMTTDPNCNININGEEDEEEYYNNDIIEEFHNDDEGECNHM